MLYSLVFYFYLVSLILYCLHHEIYIVSINFDPTESERSIPTWTLPLKFYFVRKCFRRALKFLPNSLLRCHWLPTLHTIYRNFGSRKPISSIVREHFNIIDQLFATFKISCPFLITPGAGNNGASIRGIFVPPCCNTCVLLNYGRSIWRARSAIIIVAVWSIKPLIIAPCINQIYLVFRGELDS